jgi:hypothetical protein
VTILQATQVDPQEKRGGHCSAALRTDNRLPLPQRPERCVPGPQQQQAAAATVTRETCSASDWRAPGLACQENPILPAVLPCSAAASALLLRTAGAGNAHCPGPVRTQAVCSASFFRGPCDHAHNKPPYEHASLSFHGEKIILCTQTKKMVWCGQEGQGTQRGMGANGRWCTVRQTRKATLPKGRGT